MGKASCSASFRRWIEKRSRFGPSRGRYRERAKRERATNDIREDAFGRSMIFITFDPPPHYRGGDLAESSTLDAPTMSAILKLSDTSYLGSLKPRDSLALPPSGRTGIRLVVADDFQLPSVQVAQTVVEATVGIRDGIGVIGIAAQPAAVIAILVV